MHSRLLPIMTCLSLSGALASADEKKLTCLDLQSKANMHLDEGTGGKRPIPNSFKDLKPGEYTWEDVKFNIGKKYLQLGGSNARRRPKRIEGIKVDQKCAKLHILHSTQGVVPDDRIIGEYTVTWDDETSVTIPIRYGKDLLKWWCKDGDPGPSEAKVAWTGENEASAKVAQKIRLYLTTWENPKPDKKITKIDFSTIDDLPSSPFCMAMTVEE
jgi:hypothetical protein